MISVMIFQIASGVVKLLSFALWARVILSWIPHDRYNSVIEILYNVTDPLLRPFQQLVPPEKLNGFDVSPIFAFIALNILQNILASILF